MIARCSLVASERGSYRLSGFSNFILGIPLSSLQYLVYECLHLTLEARTVLEAYIMRAVGSGCQNDQACTCLIPFLKRCVPIINLTDQACARMSYSAEAMPNTCLSKASADIWKKSSPSKAKLS